MVGFHQTVHTRVQAQISHQLIGALEAPDRADRCEQSYRDHHVDPWNGHQPLCVGASQCITCQLTFHRSEILAETIVLAHMACDRIGFIGRQWL